MKIKTPMGAISVADKGNKDYPGCWISVGEDEELVCMVEYNSTQAQFQVVVYADPDSDDPTHIIPIVLGDNK